MSGPAPVSLSTVVSATAPARRPMQARCSTISWVIVASCGIAALGLTAGACGSDSSGGSTGGGVDGFATDTPGGFANQDVSNSTGVGPGGAINVDTGVDQSCTAPERNEFCRTDYDKGNHGTTVPWCGFSHKGTDYTCDNCPGGHPLVQGVWRFVDFETEDPNTPLGDSWRETVTFDGNTWLQHSQWVDNGVVQDAVLEGWYWCSDPAENAQGTVVFVVSNTEPEGALGYADGFVFSANLLLQGTNQLDFNFYVDGFDEGANLDQLYCRTGTTIATVAGDQVPCDDPF